MPSYPRDYDPTGRACPHTHPPLGSLPKPSEADAAVKSYKVSTVPPFGRKITPPTAEDLMQPICAKACRLGDCGDRCRLSAEAA